MFKYFGLVTKEEGAVAYNIVFAMSVQDVLQVALTSGLPLSHVIEIKELEAPQWSIVEPALADSKIEIIRMRKHFFNGGCLMCEYAGIEYGIRPNLYKKPIEKGLDSSGQPVYEFGKADFINVTTQTLIHTLNIESFDDTMFLATLSYWTLRHYIEFVDPVIQVDNDFVTLH